VLDLEEIRAYYARILPFYEREAAARGDLDFWQSLARAWRPRRILEIGCGTGRVALALARTSPTIGIDISFDLLRRARRKAARGRASFLAADFRETVFSRRFDLIVAPSDPLSHLIDAADRRRALRAVARQLAPGGRFVLDALVRRGKAPVVSRRSLRDRQGSLRIREVWRPAARAGVWRATYFYSEGRPRGRRSGTEASFVARVWEPRAIRSFFSSCGLAVENLWGTLSRRPFSAASPRLIVVARPSRSSPEGA
jgi:SAM-dependent methyltransferase